MSQITVQESTLKEILASVFNVDAGSISDATSADNLVQWDSLQHLNLVLTLEESLGIRLSDDHTLMMTSMSAIKKILGEYGFVVD